MLAFAILAGESRKRGQLQGELRFLILAGIAACHAGHSEVADYCYHRILDINPHHLMSRYASITEALRSEDFQTFSQRLDRFCTYEHAEFLLQTHRPDWENLVQDQDDFKHHCLRELDPD